MNLDPFRKRRPESHALETGKIIPGTFAEEFRRSFENVRKVLAGAGHTLDDVTKVTSYVARPAGPEEYNRLYRKSGFRKETGAA